MEQMEQITFTGENGEEIVYYVVDETRINGTNYLLVAESMEDEAEAYILRDVSPQESDEAVYEFVEDDTEWEALYKVFAESMEDIELV
jgi:uncharacterized protein YrzB (UPF0473 family)